MEEGADGESVSVSGKMPSSEKRGRTSSLSPEDSRRLQSLNVQGRASRPSYSISLPTEVY